MVFQRNSTCFRSGKEEETSELDSSLQDIIDQQREGARLKRERAAQDKMTSGAIDARMAVLQKNSGDLLFKKNTSWMPDFM